MTQLEDKKQWVRDSIVFNHNPIEFDKKFGELVDRVLDTLIETVYQARTEETLEEVVKIAEEMKRPVMLKMQGGREIRDSFAAVQNGAIDDLISALKDTKINK